MSNPRQNETINGGFIVIARGKDGRLVQTPKLHPFEHPSLQSAVEEAERLDAISGNTFSVWAEIKNQEQAERS